MSCHQDYPGDDCGAAEDAQRDEGHPLAVVVRNVMRRADGSRPAAVRGHLLVAGLLDDGDMVYRQVPERDGQEQAHQEQQEPAAEVLPLLAFPLSGTVRFHKSLLPLGPLGVDLPGVNVVREDPVDLFLLFSVRRVTEPAAADLGRELGPELLDGLLPHR